MHSHLLILIYSKISFSISTKCFYSDIVYSSCIGRTIVKYLIVANSVLCHLSCRLSLNTISLIVAAPHGALAGFFKLGYIILS